MPYVWYFQGNFLINRTKHLFIKNVKIVLHVDKSEWHCGYKSCMFPRKNAFVMRNKTCITLGFFVNSCEWLLLGRFDFLTTQITAPWSPRMTSIMQCVLPHYSVCITLDALNILNAYVAQNNKEAA